MTEELAEQDKHCHICNHKSDWLVNVNFASDVHVQIAVCEHHKPLLFEVQHTENEGLISLQVDREKMHKINFGEKRKEFEMLGPDLGGNCVRRFQ